MSTQETRNNKFLMFVDQFKQRVSGILAIKDTREKMKTFNIHRFTNLYMTSILMTLKGFITNILLVIALELNI